jgi:hypothetical protein
MLVYLRLVIDLLKYMQDRPGRNFIIFLFVVLSSVNLGYLGVFCTNINFTSGIYYKKLNSSILYINKLLFPDCTKYS